jgi:hypothetical protein
MTKDDYIAKHKQIHAIAHVINTSMDTIAELINQQSLLIEDTVGEEPPDGIEGIICKEQLEYAVQVNRQLSLFLDSESEYYN